MDHRPSQEPLLVTPRRAATLLSVSERTVRRMISSGRLEVVRLTPDTPRVRYDSIVRLIADASGPRE